MMCRLGACQAPATGGTLLKLLLDLLPVFVFFITFRVAKKGFPDATTALVGTWLGTLEGATADRLELSAVILATLATIAATAVQIGWLMARRQRIKPSVWISAGLILVFGGLTVWLHNEWFIKWKPTILYWVFALVLGAGKLVWRRNLLGSLLSEEIGLPPRAWDQLLVAWVFFFFALGVANLLVAFNFDTDTWVDFKTFGLLGLTLVFSLGTGVFMSRHLAPEPGSPSDGQ